ncbi:polyprenyl synthetase family protein [Desulforhopalus singaporensis]|uniref:Farnesyl-diphosphate synthase n=1 Tax=Desulforhopalus singaporensis TaxID=91360 RepID=A0A1H0MVQ3_9BACT|nr:farnesyl-diphosphate synthase [Desulforhopalus singaporensis]
MEIKTYLSERKQIVDQALQEMMLTPEGPFADHIEAMRYSLFVGGKRVRPILCLAAAEAVGVADQQADLLPVACALECIHTYSLIHDDLPAMDDDDLRRGKPTNHTIFGEAAAILAGDGLLTWAFDLLSDTTQGNIPAETRLAIIKKIATASGPLGMVGGQALDIATENSEYPFSTLQTIHRHKTGALITCSVEVGALGAGASNRQLQQLKTFGDNIGLAFQIVDDLLDETSTTEQLGKAAGADASRGKATYPAYFGIEQTRVKAKEATDRAVQALEEFDHRADPLRSLAEYIFTRSY